MGKQNFEEKNEKISERFDLLKRTQPDRLKRRLNLSWSNWGFGLEPLADSAGRLVSGGSFRRGDYSGDGEGETLRQIVQRNLIGREPQAAKGGRPGCGAIVGGRCRQGQFEERQIDDSLGPGGFRWNGPNHREAR